MKRTDYLVIPAFMYEFPLNMSERATLAKVYALTAHEETTHCNKRYLAEFAGVTMRQVANILNKLTNEGYIIREYEKKNGQEFLSLRVGEKVLNYLEPAPAPADNKLNSAQIETLVQTLKAQGLTDEQIKAVCATMQAQEAQATAPTDNNKAEGAERAQKGKEASAEEAYNKRYKAKLNNILEKEGVQGADITPTQYDEEQEEALQNILETNFCEGVQNVRKPLTPTQYKILCAIHGRDKVINTAIALHAYIQEHPNKYKDTFATLNTWLNKEGGAK